MMALAVVEKYQSSHGATPFARGERQAKLTNCAKPISINGHTSLTPPRGVASGR